jgi:hypothetical protein
LAALRAVSVSVWERALVRASVSALVPALVLQLVVESQPHQQNRRHRMRPMWWQSLSKSPPNVPPLAAPGVA